MKALSFATRLYVSDINMPEEFFAVWYDKMPEARRRRCDRFRFDADKKRCIAAYALLVHALGDLGISCTDTLSIAEGEDGKPYLTDIPVCFNMSHAKERVALALSPQDVGCDVECRCDDALKIAKRFFAPEEYAYLESIEDADMLGREFTGIWTMKESVIKCCGEGIRRVLSDFSVTDERGRRNTTVTLPDRDERYHIKEFESEGGYCYSICGIYKDTEDDLRRVCLDESGRSKWER